jgi:hypothetical protein
MKAPNSRSAMTIGSASAGFLQPESRGSCDLTIVIKPEERRETNWTKVSIWKWYRSTWGVTNRRSVHAAIPIPKSDRRWVWRGSS